ncbi:hypothetical protein ACRRTK_023291 [Alexandromys fortis]
MLLHAVFCTHQSPKFHIYLLRLFWSLDTEESRSYRMFFSVSRVKKAYVYGSSLFFQHMCLKEIQFIIES